MKYNNIRSFLKKVKEFGPILPITNLLLVYGRRFLSYNLKCKIVSYRNRIVQKKIDNIIHIPQLSSDSIFISEERKEKTPIWYCWLQGEDKMPDIPKLCLQSIRKYSNGHPVILLTYENYRQYVTLPKFIEDLYLKGKIKNAHFADILRVYLLEQNGGLWLDSTILLTKDIPDYIFYMPFFSIKNKENNLYVSKCRWSVFCLGGFPHNVIYRTVSKCFIDYLTQQDCFVDYFMFDHFIDMAYQRSEIVKHMIDEVPYNNENVHKLAPLLCKKFDKTQFQELTKDTFLFKLNWRRYTQEELNQDADNYYHFLKSMVEDE